MLNLFQHLIPLFLFLGFYVLRTFEWLRRLTSLRASPFYGYAV